MKTEKLKILAIIPAREGSKRVKHKNFRPFAGTTLVDIAIQQGLGAKLIDDIVLSTDSEEVLSIGNKYTQIICLTRPQELSGDESSAFEYVKHALDIIEPLKKTCYDLVVILQPSSPLRHSQDIDNTIKLLLGNPNKESAVSVVRVNHMVHPAKLKRMEGDTLLPYLEEEAGHFAAHELPDIYVRNCAVYVTRKQSILTRRSVISPESLGYVMPAETSVDINELVDFELAELLYRKKYDAGRQVETKRVLVLGDSLCLPRNEGNDIVLFNETWPYLLSLNNPSLEVINSGCRSRTSLTTKNELAEIKLIQPDTVILQLGIVDAAPRIFNHLEKVILNHLPGSIRKIIINFRRGKRNKITARKPLGKVTVKPEMFYECLITVVTQIQTLNSTKPDAILMVPIVANFEVMEKKSKGFTQNINLYNSIMERISKEKQVSLVDTSVLRNGNAGNFYCKDGYHLSKDGNLELYKCIIKSHKF